MKVFAMINSVEIKIKGKGIRDKEFIRNSSNYECKCDKSCDIGEYLDYEICRCRKKLVKKLVEECSENIDRNEIIYNANDL